MPMPNIKLGPAQNPTAGISGAQGGVMAPPQSAAQMLNAANTGSRPGTPSKFPIATSAPRDARTRDIKLPEWLK